MSTGMVALRGCSSSTDGPKDASKDINRVAGGLKAAIHNPNVSAEAKAEAQTKLNALGVEEDRTATESEAARTNTHVAGGYKATLHSASSFVL